MTVLLRGGYVFQLKDGSVNFQPGDIRLNGAYIDGLAPEIKPLPGEEVWDVRGCLILPGLVNAHYHSYTNLLKGTTWGEPLEIWSIATVALGGLLTDREIAVSVLLGVAEMLHAGVTCCLDHFPHLSRLAAAAKAYQRSGFRVSLAPMLSDVYEHLVVPGVAERLPRELRRNLEAVPHRSVQELREFYLAALQEYHQPRGTMQVVVGPNAPQRASMELLEMAAELARKYELTIHTHLLETKWQAMAACRAGSSLVAKLDRAGLLGPQTAVAHAIWLEEKERALLSERDSMVVHNPTSNAMLGSGRAPLIAYLRDNIRVALGTDGLNCGTNHNLLETMRWAGLLARLEEPDYKLWPGVSDLWPMATVNGAAATGWEGVTGRLEPGYRADLIIVSNNSPALAPATNIPAQLILNETRLAVRDVFIDGRPVMVQGRILVFDEKDLRREAVEIGRNLVERSRPILAQAAALREAYEAAYRAYYLV
ncbi:amidohydrolase family protein [Neomoorella carbonis]|uniref:amidohydrolase family protein n=1 Tax=Neomoorella carbonis TaxID=3062783 RepID=UPI003245CCCF